MQNRKDVTVPMEQDLCNEIDKQLSYKDARSEWIREAVRLKLATESALDSANLQRE